MFIGKNKKVIEEETDFKINWKKYAPTLNTGPASNKELRCGMLKLRNELMDNKDTAFEGGAIIRLRKEVALDLVRKLATAGQPSYLMEIVDDDQQNDSVKEKGYYTKRLIVTNNQKVFRLLRNSKTKYRVKD